MSWWTNAVQAVFASHSRRARRLAWLHTAAGLVVIWAAVWPGTATAERGVLVVHVRLASNEPLPRLRIGMVGDGSIEFTDSAGRARIRLAAKTQPGGRVTMQIVPPPDLVLVSPWEGQAIVPSFEDDSANVLPVVVVQRSDKRMLEDAAVLAAAVAAAARSAPQPLPAAPPASRPRSGLSAGIVAASWRSHAPAGAQLAQADPSANRDVDRSSNGRELQPPFRHTRTAGSLITERIAELLGIERDELARAIDRVNEDSVTWRLVVLTGQVETVGDPFTMVVGSIQGSGLSFGPSWANARNGSLQRLLRRFREVDAEGFDRIMGDDAAWMQQWLDNSAAPAGLDERALEGRGGMRVREPWRSRFVELGRHPAFKRVQLEAMQPRADRARATLRTVGLRSERALAFVYDVLYQQGPQSALWAALPSDRAAFERAVGRAPDEEELLLIAAQRAIARAPSALRPQVASRRMAFALGQGTVYGRPVDLDDAGFGLRDADTGAPIELRRDDAVLARLKAGWIPGRDTK